MFLFAFYVWQATYFYKTCRMKPESVSLHKSFFTHDSLCMWMKKNVVRPLLYFEVAIKMFLARILL